MLVCRSLIAPLIVAAVLAPPARAGIFDRLFGRKPKPNPTERVPELLGILKSDADERKRTEAAEELSKFDPKTFPQIYPALIDALQHDTSAGVRVEVVQTLGKLRPISAQAGYALEQSQNTDNAMRVRMAARTTLFQYHLAGYRGSAKPETQNQTRA